MVLGLANFAAKEISKNLPAEETSKAATSTNSSGHCEDTNHPQHDSFECERYDGRQSDQSKITVSPHELSEGHCYKNIRSTTAWMSKASCNRSGGVITQDIGHLRRCQKGGRGGDSDVSNLGFFVQI